MSTKGVNFILISCVFALMRMTSSQDVYVFDDTSGLGRTFDGIGALSGGGATSKLLPGYPEQQRNEILDYLFKPNFGAALQILKVEIGGGSQSGIGSEATHIYYDGDENYERGYEWWIMVEAKKRNPDIKLYGLPWVMSGWVGNGTSKSPYTYPDRTATYIVKWILAAKKYYNLTIDYIGEWNEQQYNTTYLKILRKALDSAGLQNVRIVAADDYQGELVVDLGNDLFLDTELATAIDVFGVHYTSTSSTVDQILSGKSLWASEDYSTINTLLGGRCWARILNQNYVNGLMTSTIAWNLIASYYEGMPYDRCGLMTAYSPWSGYYSVDTPIWMSAHTTQFTKIGWKYLSRKTGVGHLRNGGSYVALTSPDRKDLTIVIETMAYNASQCLHEVLTKYDVQKQNLILKLTGSFRYIDSLFVWYSQIGDETQKADLVLFESLGPIQVVNGTVKLTVDVNQIYTLTTLSGGSKGKHPDPPISKPFPLPYVDTFEDVPYHQEPYFLSPMAGSFEVVPGKNWKRVLRQMTVLPPVDWCETEDFSLALVGNITWSDIFVETNFSLDVPYAAKGVFVAVRVNSGGCYTANGGGIFFHILPGDGQYQIYNDAKRSMLLGFGPVSGLNASGWNRVAIVIKDFFATAYVNGQLLFGIRVPLQPARGFVGLGTSGFGHADFDYICVMSSDDGSKYQTCKYV
ncbi:hypothetical protein ACJMK2_004834 [Sinanodonta woodiana]|uniref:galactosylceramidase n=1 Tax=Sinanodonta woodiana TaxID=1069815 RepID=A0ABD3VNH0_SINWO